MKGTLKDGSKLDVDQFLIDIYDPSVVIDQKYPDLMDAIGTSVRGLQIASPGMDLISTDFSAIEAVVIACLAGEQWRIDVFNGHGKIYEESAARGFNVPLDEF